MRRALAVLSLLTLANLTVVQVGLACESLPDGSRFTGSAAVHGAHHGASPSATAGTDAVSTAPDDRSSTSPCLAMAHCAVTLAVADECPGPASGVISSGVVAKSDSRPVSPSAAPALPPPRG